MKESTISFQLVSFAFVSSSYRKPCGKGGRKKIATLVTM